MTDTEKLRGLINDKGLKLKYVAEYLGLSPYGLQRKLDNQSEFKTSEVSALCKLLDIQSPEEKERIFFAQEGDLKSSKEVNGCISP